MNKTLNSALEWAEKHIVIIAVAVVSLVVILGTLSWVNGIDNEGYTKQRAVLQQYNVYQTELSTCLDNTSVASQIATEEYEQVKNVLTSIISARYGDEGALSEGGAFVSALQEQYPEIDRSLWKQLMTVAIGCRNQVAGVNNELQSVAARFETWTNTGGLFAKRFHNRYPTDELKVVGLTGPLSGQAALDFLTVPLTTAAATEAIRNHEMPSTDLFPDPK